MTTLQLRSGTPEQTRAIGATVASLLQPGDVIVLGGELGAGKTCFVQGAARQLGVERRVTSPTFNLIRSYPDASVPIVHVDIYRLNRLHDLLDLGDEVFAVDAVTFIEWGDAALSLMPHDRLDVEVVLGDDQLASPPSPELPSDRVVVLRGHGSWAQRLIASRDALGDWLVDDDASRSGRVAQPDQQQDPSC